MDKKKNGIFNIFDGKKDPSSDAEEIALLREENALLKKKIDILRSAARIMDDRDRLAHQYYRKDGEVDKEKRLEEELLKKRPRYSLLVDEVLTIGDNRVAVRGKLYGSAKASDQVYMYQPAGVSSDRIDRIVDDEEDPDIKILYLRNLRSKTQLAKYDVISNVAPMKRKTKRSLVENPYLVGLMMARNEHEGEKLFDDILKHQVESSIFLLPMHIRGDYKEKDGKLSLGADSQLAFPTLHNNDVKDEDTMLPLFTDWSALERWQDLFVGGEKPKTLEVRLNDAIGLVNDNTTGIVINPYGPKHLSLPARILNNMKAIKIPAASHAPEEETEGKQSEPDASFVMMAVIDRLRAAHDLWSAQKLYVQADKERREVRVRYTPADGYTEAEGDGESYLARLCLLDLRYIILVAEDGHESSMTPDWLLEQRQNEED